jgi:hypothetical protein
MKGVETMAPYKERGGDWLYNQSSRNSRSGLFPRNCQVLLKSWNTKFLNKVGFLTIELASFIATFYGLIFCFPQLLASCYWTDFHYSTWNIINVKISTSLISWIIIEIRFILTPCKFDSHLTTYCIPHSQEISLYFQGRIINTFSGNDMYLPWESIIPNT